MNLYVQSDLYRYVGEVTPCAFVDQYLNNAAFRYMVAFRLVNSSNVIEWLLRKALWVLRNRNRFQIPRNTQIGYGLYVGHSGSIVVSESATIGNNCNLSQFTTIGSNDGNAATIGDNVYIGPNVCIIEDVKISDNVTIGGVVTKDIPCNATTAGNYAKVLNYKRPGRYIGNPWKKTKRVLFEE